MLRHLSRSNHGSMRPSRRLGAAARGQSLVEFALTIPIFLALLFGTLEVGMLFKTYAAYDEAAQQAARISAAEGNASDSDTHVLTQLRTSLVAENLGQITSVAIYDATVTGAPANATAQSTYTYRGGHFYCQGPTSPPADTACPIPTGPPTYNVWDPLVRNTAANSLDHVAIRINYDYRGVTRFLPLLHMANTATTLLEPNTYPLSH